MLKRCKSHVQEDDYDTVIIEEEYFSDATKNKPISKYNNPPMKLLMKSFSYKNEVEKDQLWLEPDVNSVLVHTKLGNHSGMSRKDERWRYTREDQVTTIISLFIPLILSLNIDFNQYRRKLNQKKKFEMS